MANTQNIRSIGDLKTEIKINPDLLQAFKDDPAKAIDQLPSPVPDTWVYRMVVGSLGLAILLVIISVVTITLAKIPIESSVSTLFTAIASGAGGALAGLLAPQPKG